MDILERYFLDHAKESELYNLISNSSVNSELVSVQTCNRMELYLACEHHEILLSNIMKFFELELNEFEKTFYILQDKECVRHLFEVVSSLDSVIVGEGQILGQIRESYMRALNNGQTDKILNRLFEHAIRTGKKIRSQTDISRGAVSISNAAVELGRKVFRGLEGAKVLVLGAGHMGRLAIEHLISTKVDAVKILNRNTDRAMKLAEIDTKRISHGGLEHIYDAMIDVDLVFGALSYEGYVVTKHGLEVLMPKRRYRSLFLIDISLPRVFDPNCSSLDNIFHFDIEDLKDVVDKNKHEREVQADLAREMIVEEVTEFALWLSIHQLTPLIRDLNIYKDFLLSEYRSNCSNVVESQLHQAKNDTEPVHQQLLMKKCRSIEEACAKNANLLAGRLQFIINQLVKNYPIDPLSQQRLTKIVKEATTENDSGDKRFVANWAKN